MGSEHKSGLSFRGTKHGQEWDTQSTVSSGASRGAKDLLVNTRLSREHHLWIGLGSSCQAGSSLDVTVAGDTFPLSLWVSWA